MSDGGPRLALMARLTEAVHWNDLVRRHEDDPWGYMRRKLESTEAPLRAFKWELFQEAKKTLLADFSKPMMPPGAFALHKEVFEPMLPAGDFADLSFHLDPLADRATRLDGAKAVLDHATVPTLFDHEALPLEKRSRLWQKRVSEMSERLNIPLLNRLIERAEFTPRRRAIFARRLRTSLAEYISVAKGDGGLRDEITPFMLARIEAATAAALRFLGSRR